MMFIKQQSNPFEENSFEELQPYKKVKYYNQLKDDFNSNSMENEQKQNDQYLQQNQLISSDMKQEEDEEYKDPGPVDQLQTETNFKEFINGNQIKAIFALQLNKNDYTDILNRKPEIKDATFVWNIGQEESQILNFYYAVQSSSNNERPISKLINLTIEGTHYSRSFPVTRGRRKHLSFPYIKMLGQITQYFGSLKLLQINIEHVKSQGELNDTMVDFFRMIPGKLIFLEKFIFEMDYELSIFITSFLVFENSEITSKERKYPIQYIRICFVRYSKIIERTIDENCFENLEKKDWKNSFKYKIYLENILTSRSANILDNLDELQHFMRNLIEIRINLKQTYKYTEEIANQYFLLSQNLKNCQYLRKLKYRFYCLKQNLANCFPTLSDLPFLEDVELNQCIFEIDPSDLKEEPFILEPELAKIFHKMSRMLLAQKIVMSFCFTLELKYQDVVLKINQNDKTLQLTLKTKFLRDQSLEQILMWVVLRNQINKITLNFEQQDEDIRGRRNILKMLIELGQSLSCCQLIISMTLSFKNQLDFSDHFLMLDLLQAFSQNTTYFELKINGLTFQNSNQIEQWVGYMAKFMKAKQLFLYLGLIWLELPNLRKIISIVVNSGKLLTTDINNLVYLSRRNNAPEQCTNNITIFEQKTLSLQEHSRIQISFLQQDQKSECKK